MASKLTPYESIARGVYKVVRQFARMPFIIQEKEKVATQEGDWFYKLDGDLGSATYEELCADAAGVSLVRIIYCQRELASLRESLHACRRATNRNYVDIEKKRLINHDFLILEIQSERRHRHNGQRPIYICAEKVGSDEENKAGIHITEFKEDPADIDTRYALFSIDCRSSRFGSLLNLQKILKPCSLDYSIKDNNCWDYTLSTTKSLLKACIKIAKDCEGAEEVKRLQKELNHLEANMMQNHVLYQIKRVANFVTTKVRGLLN